MSIEIINNRQVGVSRMGSGTPMLMLHCALAHRAALAPLMSQLPPRSFTAFDLPGHGESAFDSAVDIQAQAVETAISLLEASGPSDVFGHSFGATVALKLALERPDLVCSLCLYEPVYFAILACSNPAAYQAEVHAASAFSSAALAQDWPEAARAFLARWSAEHFEALPPKQKAYILKTIPLILASEASIIAPERGEALLDTLGALTVPMCVITGENSPHVVHEIAITLAEYRPNAVQKHVKNAAHMGPITHAKDVAKLVTEFVGRINGNS